MRSVLYTVLLAVAILVLFALNLLIGSVHIPAGAVYDILMGHEGIRPSWQYIILESRWPQALTALLAGGALSVSGLLLQTAFHNPLAGPDVFGVNSGAALGVALVMLGSGGVFTLGAYSVAGFVAILVSAFLGALAVTAIIFLFSLKVRHKVLLLIVGVMMGYLASSLISLLSYLATEEGVKSYAVWGMGTFGNVARSQLPLFSCVVICALVLAMMLVKPLNALLLGEQYAENLGFRTRRLRHLLLLVTGLLSAVVTAFCGPVSFIGLATPHIVRLFLHTDNHRLLLPLTLFTGSALALLCNLLTVLPPDGSLIPLSVVTPLVGAPVIIYVLVREGRASR